jgi:hypothetical protein
VVTDILMLLGLFVGFLYWWSASRGRELARHAGRQACEVEHVQFLDDTVVLVRMHWRRDGQGRWAIYREYQFEFASDGGRRYGGEIVLLGRELQRVTLEPYRISPMH